MSYLVAYALVYGVGMWHATWALAGNSQTTEVFKAKLEWTDDETVTYNTLISSSGIVGMAIGCAFGGHIIQCGRRKGAIAAHFLAIIGASITMICNVPCLSLGRVLLGTAATTLMLTFGKCVVENMPEKLASKFAMFVNAGVSLGFIPCYAMGSLLPDPEDEQANKDDENWRIIFMVPALLGIIAVVMLVFFFRDEPITFCIANNR